MRVSLSLLLFPMLVAALCSAQLSQSASVVLSAKKTSSISLSLQTVPVSIDVNSGTQMAVSVPLTLQWNVDPREVPGFGVVAYFAQPHSALYDNTSGTSISADKLLANWGDTAFQSFNEAGSLTLFHTMDLADNRRGDLTQTLSLMISESALANLADGKYQGVLYLEVRNF